MATNYSDYVTLNKELAALPTVRERVEHLVLFMRIGLDSVRSECEWDGVEGISGLLGVHSAAIADAVQGPQHKGK